MAQFRLILGGGASGKSRYAEGLVMAMPQPRAYIATAQAWDDEMRAKIAQHQQQRGPDWLTIEVPQELPKALRDLPSDHVVLIDCATLWLSNLMLDNKDLL
ncbi:MAG: bifunctional adenosylcobinamide kinase/adenosylcobinamide-phosphate guanylyltransferase, partial [Mangrovicoccus sp.]